MLKKIKFAIVLIFALIIVFLLALLVPAHLQIRSVEIVLPQLDDIRKNLSPDEAGKANYPVAIHYVNTAKQQTPVGMLGHVGVLIQWPDGKQFLIDAGMNESDALAFGKPFELVGAGPSQTFGAIEKQLGDSVHSIKGIGFTHLHSDHTLGITAICKALAEPATIFQSSQQASLHNHLTKAGQDLIHQSVCNKQTLDDVLIKAVPGFPGLFALAAGGHTPGSTVFITQVENKIWIFAGDLTNAMHDIHDNKGKGWMYSYLLVPEDTKLLEQWRLWLEQVDAQPDIEVLVAHDIKAYENSEIKPW